MEQKKRPHSQQDSEIAHLVNEDIKTFRDKKRIRRVVIKKIPGGKANPLIKTIEKIKIDVPDSFPPLHTTALAVGSCNSGKTNWIYNLVHYYMLHGSFTRIMLLSPTADNNKADFLNIQESDQYKGKRVLEQGIECVREIEEKVKEEAELYEAYEEYKAAWDAWINGIESIYQQNMLEKNQYAPPKYMKRPSICLIMDDLSHTKIFSTSRENSFINMLLRHRHIYGIGLSIFMAVQNFNTGVPKILRQNIKQFFLWKTHDSTQLKSIYEQVAQGCNEEEFYTAFEEATSEKHGFLTVDLNSNTDSVFRKNFDEELSFV